MSSSRYLKALVAFSCSKFIVALPSSNWSAVLPKCQQMEVGMVCAEVLLDTVEVNVNVTSPHCMVMVDETSVSGVSLKEIHSGNRLIRESGSHELVSSLTMVAQYDFGCDTETDAFVLSGHASFVCKDSRGGRRRRRKSKLHSVPFDLQMECTPPPLLLSKPPKHPHCATGWAWTEETNCADNGGELVECASCHPTVHSLPSVKGKYPRFNFLEDVAHFTSLGPFNFYDLEEREFTFFVPSGGCDTSTGKPVATISMKYVQTRDSYFSSMTNTDFVVVTIKDKLPQWELASFHLHVGLSSLSQDKGTGNDSIFAEFNPKEFPVGHTFDYGDSTSTDTLVVETTRFPKVPAYISISGTVCDMSDV